MTFVLKVRRLKVRCFNECKSAKVGSWSIPFRIHVHADKRTHGYGWMLMSPRLTIGEAKAAVCPRTLSYAKIGNQSTIRRLGYISTFSEFCHPGWLLQVIGRVESRVFTTNWHWIIMWPIWSSSHVNHLVRVCQREIILLSWICTKAWETPMSVFLAMHNFVPLSHTTSNNSHHLMSSMTTPHHTATSRPSEPNHSTRRDTATSCVIAHHHALSSNIQRHPAPRSTTQ